ncbi:MULTISPECIES: hypothetical protein [unclassified Rhizobium]|jgi:hypothetical protein|uniref:hypothetical protein n=1 Tax=unclassified Rhizobium TaxID=2613769 RepID=UPI001C83FA21|nr:MULTISPECIES: hypothetical protein [unclassified Rhizobium]MBX5164925.1 hypothetical protein [Rhizobium sp. NZLR4b]MBX5170060.1 hypothetical protein [Rhizobium sp. NZLR1b]MBX5184867.1 hypothetical protein [Rhizobium sp. NZLR5]MBX5193000.1 hypothetical protein [Rhizobium sp. NZLR3b]MBX5209740.1 hypothetical protein [Rhizobium sp. NZLR11]
MAATSDANFFMLAAPAALSEKLSTTSINEGVRYSKFRRYIADRLLPAADRDGADVCNRTESGKRRPVLP